MPRLLSLLVGFLAFTGGTFAQINTDSIRALAAQIDNPEERLYFLESATSGRPFNTFDQPTALFTERLALTKQLQDYQREVSTALSLIRAANYVGQYGYADSLSLHYVETADRVELPYHRSWLLHEAAAAHFFSQRYPEAIRADSAALRATAAIEPAALADSMAVHIHNYLGKSFNASGRFVEAATVLQDGLVRLSPPPDKTEIRRELYTELGIVFSQIGLYDQAVDYLDRTMDPTVAPSAIAVAHTSVNIGRNLLLTGEFSAAKERFRTALAQDITPAQQLSVYPYAYNGLVEASYRLNDRDSLQYYYDAFVPLAQQARDNQVGNDFLFQQSTFLHRLTNGRYSEAENIGQQLYTAALDKNDPAETQLYTEFLTDLYRRQGNFREADQYSQRLLYLRDSIRSANRNDALLLYYNQFQTQEKENEILRLEAEQLRIDARRRQFQIAAVLLALLLLTGLFFYFRLRSARRQLADQNDELTQLNATKDRFFGIIAHDLRNPIVALETADKQVDALLARGKTEAVQKVVGQVSQTAGRLSGLLDNLMQWALGQSGSITLYPTMLDLGEVVGEITDLYGPAAASKDITLLAPDLADTRVRADKNALRTILRNLVGNAVKFTPANQDKTITISHHRHDQFEVIRVIDQGAGIPVTNQGRLFRLHDGSTAGRRQQGTGLGLILVKELAELHGGKVSFESTEGVGTTFSVWLPV